MRPDRLRSVYEKVVGPVGAADPIKGRRRMNDNGAPNDRSDPFGRGLAAHRARLPRSDCPFPGAHVEARRWLAGWDHAEFKAEDRRDGPSGWIGRVEDEPRS